MDGFRGKLLSNQNQPDWLKYEGDRLSKTPRNMAKLSVLVQRIRIWTKEHTIDLKAFLADYAFVIS